MENRTTCANNFSPASSPACYTTPDASAASSKNAGRRVCMYVCHVCMRENRTPPRSVRTGAETAPSVSTITIFREHALCRALEAERAPLRAWHVCSTHPLTQGSSTPGDGEPDDMARITSRLPHRLPVTQRPTLQQLRVRTPAGECVCMCAMYVCAKTVPLRAPSGPARKLRHPYRTITIFDALRCMGGSQYCVTGLRTSLQRNSGECVRQWLHPGV